MCVCISSLLTSSLPVTLFAHGRTQVSNMGEPGQKIAKNPNPDPLASVTGLAMGRECALVFYSATDFRRHYREVHPRFQVPAVADNYLKQRIYSYLTKSKREHNYKVLLVHFKMHVYHVYHVYHAYHADNVWVYRNTCLCAPVS